MINKAINGLVIRNYRKQRKTLYYNQEKEKSRN